jgi:LPPG:FO 2-phospho-L-lactate transferase
MRTVLLAGGTGGAKLARGLLDVVGPSLTVVVNTGDDVEAYEAHVSPDPDLVTFWLADRIDPRGWGLAGDTFAAMDQLAELGDDPWFRLGDRDLAIGLRRARRLREGASLTVAIGEQADALGIVAAVLPMSDDPVRTRVMAGGEWWPLQDFLIRRGGEGPVEGVELEGVEAARPSDAVLEAVANAEAIVIGPSNPIISIGPILALSGMREALAAAAAPVVGVSPIVGGQVLKGPTADFLAWAGHEATTAGIAAYYAEVIDGLVADERLDGADVPLLVTDIDLNTPTARERVARETLDFARGLA